MAPTDAIVQGAIINSANSILSFNPFKGQTGLNTLMWPGKIKDFLTGYVGATVKTILLPTTFTLQNTDYRRCFVIGLVHHSSNSITNASVHIPNHYVQLTGMRGDTVYYWTWGEAYDRTSHIYGIPNGIYEVFVVDRSSLYTI